MCKRRDWRERWHGFSKGVAPATRVTRRIVGGTEITREVCWLVEQALSKSPMSALTQYRWEIMEIIQRSRNGEPVEIVGQSYRRFLGGGHAIYYVSHFLIQNTSQDYHDIFRY